MSACASTATPRDGPPGERTSARSDHPSLVRTSSDSTGITTRGATPLACDDRRRVIERRVWHTHSSTSGRVGERRAAKTPRRQERQRAGDGRRAGRRASPTILLFWRLGVLAALPLQALLVTT